MISALQRHGLLPDTIWFRRRGIPLLLTLVVHALILLLFLLNRAEPLPVKEERAPTTFTLMPEAEKTPERAKAKARHSSEKVATEAPAPAPQRPTPPTKAAEPAPPFITLSKQDYAASNIANLPSAKSSAAGAGDSKAVSGPGEGPGGVQLFEAQWYRHPTDTELSGYLPATAPRKGWGLVACKTIEDYHVDNCQSLGESPLGSGFARAVRQAAWQFRVLPPRIDGHVQVGAWVRIRIDYTQTSAPDPADGGPPSGPQ